MQALGTLRAYQAVDFDDLISLPVRLFDEHPEVRERWQNKLRYLLVDEYQDTNRAQYRLLKLATPGAYTFVLEGTKELPRRILHPKRKTLGLRIPDNRIMLGVLEVLGEPLLTTMRSVMDLAEKQNAAGTGKKDEPSKAELAMIGQMSRRTWR